MIGVSIFALCLWIRFEPNMGDWLEKLNATQIYSGIYVLIIGSVIVMVVAFIGCMSALQESALLLLVVSPSIF